MIICSRVRILDVIQSTAAFFQKKGVESPRLQIELLLAHHLGLKRLDLYLQFERVLSGAELAPLREMVKKRAEGIPLQHITGVAPFYGRDFLVSPEVLIPRPETESLVEETLRKLRGEGGGGETAQSKLLRALDLCTGSGAIGITLALECPTVEIVAVDISETALQMARSNAGKWLDQCERVRLIRSDLFDSVEGIFDCVVTNPPYVASGVIPTLSREVGHDPVLALDGGPDGLEVIRRIVSRAGEFLTPQGWLLMEIGHDQGAQALKLCEEAGFQECRVIADLNGLDRIVTARKAD